MSVKAGSLLAVRGHQGQVVEARVVRPLAEEDVGKDDSHVVQREHDDDQDGEGQAHGLQELFVHAPLHLVSGEIGTPCVMLHFTW